MSKNKEFVKFEKVDKSYEGKILVVKDLNLDISEGEFITMLGCITYTMLFQIHLMLFKFH